MCIFRKLYVFNIKTQIKHKNDNTNTKLVIVVNSGKSDEAWDGEERFSLFFPKYLFLKEKKKYFLKKKAFS